MIPLATTPLVCTVLGCGTSSGVPVLAVGWGKCDPANPKNLRTRCSLLMQWREGEEEGAEGAEEAEEAEGTGERRGLLRSVLIDSSPDCRAQLLRAGIARLDAVLYTHDHADHCHGIDDLKWMRGDETIAAYANASTLESLQHRFGYVFGSVFDSVSRSERKHENPLYRPILSGVAIEPWREFSPVSSPVSSSVSSPVSSPVSSSVSSPVSSPIASSVSSGVDLGARVLPIALDHGFFGEVLGFRLGNVAYTTDCVSLSERAFKALEGVKTWIVGCLRREEHPTHAHLSRVVGWAERVGAERVYLTHMNASMDYDRLCEELPSYIRPAYDFLRVSGEF